MHSGYGHFAPGSVDPRMLQAWKPAAHPVRVGTESLFDAFFRGMPDGVSSVCGTRVSSGSTPGIAPMIVTKVHIANTPLSGQIMNIAQTADLQIQVKVNRH